MTSSTTEPDAAAAGEVPTPQQKATPSRSRARRIAVLVWPAFAVYALTTAAHLLVLSAMIPAGGPSLQNRLTTWDGGLYLDVAAHGYRHALSYDTTGKSLAFFPLYPMLTRAVRNEAGPQVGFIRADAQRLPLRDNTVDAVVSLAVLQLIPKPAAALAEIARVLRPGGRLAIMVPTAGRAARLWQMMPNVGAHAFGDDEIADILEDNGFASVRVNTLGTFQWVRAKNG